MICKIVRHSFNTLYMSSKVQKHAIIGIELEDENVLGRLAFGVLSASVLEPWDVGILDTDRRIHQVLKYLVRHLGFALWPKRTNAFPPPTCMALLQLAEPHLFAGLYFNGMNLELCVAPIPGRPCFTGL